MGTDMDDDFMDDNEAPPPDRCELSQLSDSIIDLSRAIDTCRDVEARNLLMAAMKSIVYVMNPPKGELIDMKVKKTK
jgi:hypothetical protein